MTEAMMRPSPQILWYEIQGESSLSCDSAWLPGCKLHGDVGFWSLQCINMLIINIKWPGNTHLKKIYRHIKIKLMAPSTLAECVKLEVSTWCLQAAWETETLKGVICDSESGGKGALWGECRLRRWAPPGSISCQLQCWRQLQEWRKLRIWRLCVR